jgi:simple sugar transport system ATP-binding protein
MTLIPAKAGGPPRLQLRGITKRYPAITACNGVDLAVRAGEIHALLGENGAGKTTLMKIVYGLIRPDAGTLEWEGRPVSLSSPREARRLGIGMVFQHFSLFETLTVAENIALALDERVPPEALTERIREASMRYGLAVDPQRLVHGMSVGERQRVEIVRCLLQKPKLLILDEPTSVLTPPAAEKVFETLRQLASEGVSILYISHKLAEIRSLCRMATVLRGGRVAGVVQPTRETPDSLARLMVGSEVKPCQLTPRTPGEPRLELIGLTTETDDPFGTRLTNISLEVRSGEIVGLAGVSGNGQSELLAALSGETPKVAGGEIKICGRPVAGLGPAARRALGLAFVPEERLGRGAVPQLSLARNAVLTGWRSGLVRKGLVQEPTAHAFARATIEELEVRGGDERSLAESLSGGNLQKFIVGRETRLRPQLLIAAQPTWGVDVAAAQLIRRKLIALRDGGTGLLLVSEDLDELFMICDRIAVIAAGRLSPALPRSQLTIQRVGTLMTGGITEGTQQGKAQHA